MTEFTYDDILDATVTFINQYNKYPTLVDLDGLGITRAMVRTNFNSLTNLKAIAYKLTKGCIFDLELEKLNKRPAKNIKRFVITTAVVGAEVDVNFYKNIKSYCNDNNATLIIIPASNNPQAGWVLDPILSSEVVIKDDMSFNDNVFILGINNNAKAIDPITGLPRVGRRNGTFISASPKQRLKFIATGSNKLPHALMSTGAITLPNYTSRSLMTNKAVYMADQDHIMGAIILELDKDNLFHFRQIQADVEGSFVDLGMLYNKGKKSFLAPEAFVLGDWHSGETDPVVASTWEKITKELKIPRWIIHDGFSGRSVNHHNIGKHIKKAQTKLTLDEELNGYYKDLNNMTSFLKEVVIVKSNHDDFLERYLDEARYVEDPQNHELSLELALQYLRGANPIQYYMENKKPKLSKNIKWLKREDDCYIAGIQLSAHGDEGGNGSRGSATNMETAHGDVVYGHSHTPSILRGAWCVGTTSNLQLDYNSGPSSWFHTSCLVYPNGQRQLINCIEGRYKI